MLPYGNIFNHAILASNSVLMPEDELKEVLVPCPNCRKVHKVSVKDAREKPCVTVECGAVIGSAGVLRRAEDTKERVKKFQGTLHQLK